MRTGGAAVGVAAGAYQAYEGAKAASEAKSIEETILPGLNIGAGGATALGGIGVLAGSKSLAALGPAGWVLGAGIGGFAGGKWLADNALTPLMGIHEAGTTQTYTGSEADKLLHPDEESSGPGSVTETKSYAGKAADAILHPGTKSYEGDDAQADKKLHPENYSWYDKPWFGL